MLPVIMVSVQPESQYALRCLQAGATAYINKNSASEELVPAIREDTGSDAKLDAEPELKIVIEFDESAGLVYCLRESDK
jgi:two-component system invasion response regulator UvrY